LFDLGVAASCGHEAKPKLIVNISEYFLLIFEVIDRCKVSRFNEVPEEWRGAGVGGDTRGQDQAAASSRSDCGASRFGEDSIGV
jgi:hypothetical protein